MRSRERGTSGFTLLEVLIVGTLLMLLAATFVPEFTAAHEDARCAAVVEDLTMLRKQIDLYRHQHDGRVPGYATTSEEVFLKQLRRRTDQTGVVSSNGKYGPYLSGEMPRSPFKDSSKVLVVLGPLKAQHADGQGDHGWAYSASTGEIRANVSVSVIAPNGKSVNQL